MPNYAILMSGKKVDVFASPTYVVVNPPVQPSTRFDNPMKVTVSVGKKRYKKYEYDPQLTAYDSPTCVTVTLANGRVQTFKGLAFTMVYGPHQQFDVPPQGAQNALTQKLMGADEKTGTPWWKILLGVAAIGGVSYFVAPRFLSGIVRKEEIW